MDHQQELYAGWRAGNHHHSSTWTTVILRSQESAWAVWANNRGGGGTMTTHPYLIPHTGYTLSSNTLRPVTTFAAMQRAWGARHTGDLTRRLRYLRGIAARGIKRNPGRAFGDRIRQWDQENLGISLRNSTPIDEGGDYVHSVRITYTAEGQPTVLSTAIQWIKTCENCQRSATRYGQLHNRIKRLSGLNKALICEIKLSRRACRILTQKLWSIIELYSFIRIRRMTLQSIVYKKRLKNTKRGVRIIPLNDHWIMQTVTGKPPTGTQKESWFWWTSVWKM